MLTDLDLTLTNSNLVIEPKVVDTVQRLRRAEIQVILASGGSIYSVQSVAHYIGATKAAVGENGGVISLGPKIQVLGGMEEPVRAYQALRKELGPVVTAKTMKPRFSEIVLERMLPLHKARDIIRSQGIDAKIVDTRVAYHLMSLEVDKGKGATHVLRKLRLLRDEVVVFGDGENDIELFHVGGYRIALANSVEELKRRADWVSNEGFGDGFVDGVGHLAREDLIPKDLIPP